MVTLEEIAAAVGCSVTAVSRVLNQQNKENRPSSIARAQKIRATAKKLGYRPNAAAQAVKLGTFNTIMFLKSSSNWEGNVSEPLLTSIQRTLHQFGYKLMLEILPESFDEPQEIPRFFQERCVDGVLVSITRNIPNWLNNALDLMKIPRVWIGSKQEYGCVCHDDYASSRGAVKMLATLGHKKIAYVNLRSPLVRKPQWHFSTFDRMTGYTDEMVHSGLKPIVVHPDEPINACGKVDYAWNNVIKKHRPTAVIAYGADCLRSVFYACARNGIRIPDDLSALTWARETYSENDVTVSCYTDSSLGVGEVAAKMIETLIRNPEKKMPSEVLPFELYEGGSTAQIK